MWSFLFGIVAGVIITIATFFLLLVKFNLYTSGISLRTSGDLLKLRLDDALKHDVKSSSTPRVQPISSLLPSFLAGHEDQDADAPVSLASVVEDFNAKSVDAIDVPESTVWINILISRALQLLTDFGNELDENVTAKGQIVSSSSKPLPNKQASAEGAGEGGEKGQNDDDSAQSQGGHYISSLINRHLAQTTLPSPIHSLRVTSLSLGTIAPMLHSVRVLPSDPEEPLLLDVDFTYAGDTRVEMAVVVGVGAAITQALGFGGDDKEKEKEKEKKEKEKKEKDEQKQQRDEEKDGLRKRNPSSSSSSSSSSSDSAPAKKPEPLLSLPATIALSNVLLSGKMRICIDTSLTSPGISFCFLAPPTLRFNAGTALGYRVQLLCINALPALLHSALTHALHAAVLAPNMVSYALPTDVIDQAKRKMMDILQKA